MNKENPHVQKRNQGQRMGRHRNVIMLLAILGLSMMVCLSCSTSRAPSCTDEPVKKLVLDISAGEVRNQLFQAGKIEYGIRDGRGVLPGTYDDFRKLQDTPGYEKARELMSFVDQQITAANISLTNIRLNGKHDEIKKCECGGDLVFSNGKTHPITYTAQYTEDGKVYVEVSGLK